MGGATNITDDSLPGFSSLKISVIALSSNLCWGQLLAILVTKVVLGEGPIGLAPEMMEVR